MRGRPFVLGLTGSIGMGKSATAALFAQRGVPVHDADAAVHALYGPGGAAAEAIGREFPGTLDAQGGVDRAALREAVLGDAARLKRLESLVHPWCGGNPRRSSPGRGGAARRPRHPAPLRDRRGGRCDAVAVVSAPAAIQRDRVLARPGMTEAAFAAILAKQMPDAEKRARADYVIDTGSGFPAAEAAVARIVADLTASPPVAPIPGKA